MYVTLALVCAKRGKKNNLKLSSDGGDSGSKKCKRSYGSAYGEVWRSLRLTRVWSQAIGSVMVPLKGIWVQSPLRCFHIYFIEKSINIFYM
jgi:hypothetical protein